MNESLSFDELWLMLQKQEIEKEPFYRLSILDYQYGDIKKALIYKNYYGSEGIHSELKIALSDLLAQIHIFCLSQDISFYEIESLGLLRLREFCLRRMKK
jgi:hypothetical protein